MKRILTTLGLLLCLGGWSFAQTLNVAVTLQTDPTCANSSNGLIAVSATGGLAPYIYLWSNGMVGPLNANLAAGVYTVTATDLLGATGTLTVTLDAPDPLEVDVTAQVNINCLTATGSATIAVSGGTAPYTVIWTNLQTGLTATNLTAGLHVATVTDANGCIATATVLIEADLTLPTVVLNANADLQIDCNDPQVTIDVDAAGTGLGFLWTTLNGHIVAGVTSEDVVVDAAGTYTLLVTDLLSGCTNTLTVTVTANLSLPTVNIQAGVGVDLQLDCLTPQLTISGSGSATGANIVYLWTTVNGHIVAGANTLNVVVDAAGTYTLQVTDNVTGCSNTAQVTVTADLTLPTAVIAVGANVDLQLDCNSPTLTLNATGSSTGSNYTYLWTTVNGNITAGANTLMATVNAAGTYLLQVTDTENGCSATAIVTVTANFTAPIASATVTGTLGCNTSTITINGSASSQGPLYTYLWTTVNGNIVSGANTANPTVNAAGVYVLVVTNILNGCTASASVTVTGSPTLNVSIGTQTNVLCFGQATGAVNLAVTGGTGAYTYAWSNGMTTASVTNLAAGLYTATVSDANGCQAVVSVNITQPQQLQAAVASTPATGGQNNGTATVTVTGGTTPYSYAWSNGGTGASNQNMAAGTYTVTVTDAQGCTLTVTVIIGNSANCNVAATTSVQATQCNQSTGSATVTVTGGTTPFIYAWSNGMTTASVTNLAAGAYVVTVTDAQGCTTVTSAIIVSIDNTAPVVITQNATVYLDASGSASVTTNMINNGSFDQCSNTVTLTLNINSFGCSQIGTHTVVLTVTDASGNSATGTATVTVIDTIAPTLVCPANLTHNGVGPVIYNQPSIQDNCPTAGAAFVLLGGLPSGSIFPSGTTTVVYGIVTPSGGLATCSFTVTVTSTLVVTFDITPPSCPGESDGSITANVSGGSGVYSYLWSNGQTGQTINNVGAGNYWVVVTDSQGNAITVNVTVPNPTPITLGPVIVTDDCLGNNQGSIGVTVTGGTGPYTYEWTDANGNVVGTSATLGNVPSGNYILVITDANGCTYSTGVITVDFTTSVVETELDSYGLVSAFPNPTADGLVTLGFTLPQPTDVRIELYDATGQLLQTQHPGVLQQANVNLGLNSYARGQYVVKIITNSRTFTKKVIFLD